MVTTAPRPTQTKQKNTDAPAREYIKSLACGVKPPTRPIDFGQWEHIIAPLEEKFDKYKGDTKRLGELLTNLREFNPSLDELLAPTVDEIIAAEPPEPLFPPLPESAYLPPELSRGACPWLDDYIEFSRLDSNRAYDEFHMVCGLWLLSTVAARRVYVPIGAHNTYTNFMIAMCGPSSKNAKSWTAEVAIDVLRKAKLDFLMGPNDFTPQALLSSMSGKHVPVDYAELTDEQKEYTRQKLGMASQKGVYLDEFGEDIAEMLQKNSVHAAKKKLLLTLDNCRPQHEVLTIARRSEIIYQPYLTLLGSMTYSSLSGNMKRGADLWGNGFCARFSFIAAPRKSEHKERKIKIGQREPPARLINEIKAWHQRLGIPECRLEQDATDKTGKVTIIKGELLETECTFHPDIEKLYDIYDNTLDIMTDSFAHEDFNASYTRLPVTALRIAVLLASLENNNHIEVRHWAKGREIAEIFRKNLHIMYAEVNVAIPGKIKTIEDDIKSKLADLSAKGIKGMTPSKLQGSYLKSYSVEDVRKTMESLEKSHVLVMVRTAHAPKGKYFLVADAPQEEEKEEEKT